MSLGMHARQTSDVIAALRVDPQRGLPVEESFRRSIHFGRNLVGSRCASLACVLHDGEEMFVRAIDLVPGDVIVVDHGWEVPADARIVTATRLLVDEFKLTGGNAPVAKSPSAVNDGDPLSERTSMLYLGTRVVEGRATAIVTAIGDATEISRRK